MANRRRPSPLLPDEKRHGLQNSTNQNNVDYQRRSPLDNEIDQQLPIVRAMSLESPTDMVETPTSLKSGFGSIDASSVSTASSPIGAGFDVPTAPLPTQKSKFKSALEDARHFAGGLITHPHESTKHYSILRHSHGIVYYSGSSTSLAITVFADRELPPDRTLWLQRKGFSGHTGLRIGGLLGARSTWIDITPAIKATPDQVKPTDERAWQRDIQKFLKKAPKEIRHHAPRETNVLRIPCEAEDGYLRVVLCTAEGKKVLCGSPIFRLASTSTDSSSIRGASLKIMPLEVGIKVGSFIANEFATATVAPLIETARGFATSQVTRIVQPNAVAQQAVLTAYDSHVAGRIDEMNEQYDERRETSFQRDADEAPYDALMRPRVVGDPDGPVSPFPVRFHGRVIEGSGKSKAQIGIPTANLDGVPEDILLRHKGVFFGWAAISLPKKQAIEHDISDEWRQAVIFISPDAEGRRTVMHRNSVRAYIIEDFSSVQFFQAKLSLILMGFLRHMEWRNPGDEFDPDAAQFDIYKDISITTASLARPAWAADATLERVKSAASSRSLTERYIDLRSSSQKQIDRVPVHKLGLRTESFALKDTLVGVGGISIPR